MPAEPVQRKELILHVGMGKTGTTALQEFFWANREALARHGVTYPQTGAVAGAHHLVSPHVPPFLSHAGWTFLAPQDWVEQVSQAPTPRILMSSELISWGTPEKLRAFCAALRPHFDLRVCIYLRRQDNIIMAGYNQQIKAGTQLRSLDTVLERQIDRFDYLAKIWPWEDALGADRLVVRPYERAQFKDGDLLRDFLHNVLGIESMNGFTVPQGANANPRFNNAALEYKRLINNVLPEPEQSGHFNDALADYCARTDDSTALIFHEQATLTHARRAHVLRVFAASNAYIARKFLGRADGRLFTETLPPQRGDPVDTVPDSALGQISAHLENTDPAASRWLRSAAQQHLEAPEARIREAAQRLLESFGENCAAPPSQRRRGRLIVHFGLHGTEAGAIQNTLARNPQALCGYRYVGFDRVNGSWAMNAIFLGHASHNATSDTFRAALRSLGDATGIISAESVGTFPAHALDTLIDTATDCETDVEFVGYIPTPESQCAIGWLRTLMHRLIAPEALPACADASRGDEPYYRIVDRLITRVGAARVRAFRLGPHDTQPAEVARHFLREIGVSPDQVKLHEGSEMLSVTAVRALHAYRTRIRRAETEPLPDQPLGALLHALRMIDGPRLRLGGDLVEQIRRRHSPFEDWAAARLSPLVPDPAERNRDAADDEAVGSLDSLIRLTSSDLERLAAWGGVAPPRGVDGMAFAAQLLEAVRARGGYVAQPDTAHNAEGSLSC